MQGQIWKLEVKTFHLAPRFMGLLTFKCPKKLTEPKVRVYMSPTVIAIGRESLSGSLILVLEVRKCEMYRD